jgi:hypothetical protein
MPPPTNPHTTDVAQLCGYSAAGSVVYSETLARGDYWDGEHIWDSFEKIRAIGMIKLVGKLYDENGLLYEEFENAYSPESGNLIGGRESWSDGTKKSFGTLAEA